MVETGMMRTEIVYNNDKTKRYRLTKIWDESKPRAMALLTNASSSDVVAVDFTTLYIIRNLNALEFGGVDILNMTATITTKISIPKEGDFEEDSDNIKHILDAASSCSHILLMFGKLAENNKKVKTLQDKILEKLSPFADKLYGVTNDEKTDNFFHALAPQIRSAYILKPFPLPKAEPPVEEVKQSKSGKNKKLQTTAPADLPVLEIKEDDKTKESA